ncbi:MAG: hypothetical protein EHM70_15725 [Chloroflexota bacterium]|nr:MAG: hypothetical protein EHM70_15725 [Chloroflexota bacterium]
MLGTQAKDRQHTWGSAETVFVSWVGAALAVLIPAALFLQGAFPVFTVVWLAIPLLAVTRSKDAARVGFRRISWKVFITTTAINLSALLFVSVLVEPWSHAYQALIRGAVATSHPDTTFAWLVRYEGLEAWAGLVLYSGLVTNFGASICKIISVFICTNLILCV